MSRSVLSRFLALLGAGGFTVACNTGGATINPVPDTEVEPNGTVDQATPLGGPGQFLASGQCNVASDVDHFALAATSGANASATIDMADAPIESVALLSSDGSVLVSASGGGPVEAAVTGSGGTVVLRVTCGLGSGGYSGTFESE